MLGGKQREKGTGDPLLKRWFGGEAEKGKTLLMRRLPAFKPPGFPAKG
jgi:hypothetical protein